MSDEFDESISEVGAILPVDKVRDVKAYQEQQRNADRYDAAYRSRSQAKGAAREAVQQDQTVTQEQDVRQKPKEQPGAKRKKKSAADDKPAFFGDFNT